MSYLNSFDILSHSPQLFINKHKSHKTTLGSILSLISLLLIFSFSVYFLTQTFNRSIINVRYNEVSKFLPSYNFSSFPFAFVLIDRYGQQYENQETVFSFYMEHMTFLKESEPIITPVYLEKCTNDHFGDYVDIMSKIDKMNFAYCIPVNKYNLTLYGKYGQIGESGFSIMDLFILKCVNTTTSSQCKDIDTIDELLKEAYFLRISIDYQVNHNNIESPFEITHIEETSTLSSKIYKTYFTRFRNLEYNTDYGFFFEEIHTENNFRFSRKELEVDLRSEGAIPGSFSEMNFIMDEKKDVFDRSFIKLQTVVANIGGVTQGIINLALIIMSLFSEKLYNLTIINDVYKINESDNIRYVDINKNMVSAEDKIFKLGWKDYVFKCCKKNKTYIDFSNDIRKRVSIEALLKFTYDLDFIKKTVLNNEQIKVLGEKVKISEYDNGRKTIKKIEIGKLNSSKIDFLKLIEINHLSRNNL